MTDHGIPATVDASRLLRIQEVAAETGLTPRTIRYYEEIGLLAPAARSEGAYRLYDPEDLERLRFIRGLRDDAGFSLAEIGQLLEDEQARARNRDQFRATTDAAERRAIVTDALERLDRQVDTLRRKAGRLGTMIAEAEDRRAHLAGHLVDIDAGREPSHGPGAHVHPAPGLRSPVPDPPAGRRPR
jgi:MerR family transcriptional regulator, repressor of the yfmOP operon